MESSVIKMKLNLDVDKIDVLLTNGTDKITIYLNNCTCPFPAMPDCNCNLNFECYRDLGEQYVINNFGIKPNIINSRINKTW